MSESKTETKIETEKDQGFKNNRVRGHRIGAHISSTIFEKQTINKCNIIYYL